MQELWLSSEHITLLRLIHKEIATAMNDQLGIFVGCPFSGFGVSQRKSIPHAVTVSDLQDVRLLGNQH